MLSKRQCSIYNPYKLCLIKYELENSVYNFVNWLFYIVVSLQKWFAHFDYSPFKFMYLLFISSRRNDLGTYFQVGRTPQKYSRLVTLLNVQILSFVQQGPRTNWQADNLYINLACLSVCLSVCLFVSNKRQNGWTDRAQIFCGTSCDPREGLWNKI